MTLVRSLAACIAALNCTVVAAEVSSNAWPARPLVFGYLNDLRSTNPPAALIEQLDFDAVDVIVQGFAEPRPDGGLGFGLGRGLFHEWRHCGARKLIV